MNWMISWLPWIAVALIPGVIHFPFTLRRLYKDCEFLPSPKLLRLLVLTPVFYVYSGFQLLLPGLLIWTTGSFSSKPNINLGLILAAVAVGLFFATITNTGIQIGSFRLDIKSTYGYVNRILFELIALKLISEARTIYINLEEELKKTAKDNPPAFNQGLRQLERYIRLDPFLILTPDRNQQIRKHLYNISEEVSIPIRVQTLIQVMDISVKWVDWSKVLSWFGISDEWLRNNFL